MNLRTYLTAGIAGLVLATGSCSEGPNKREVKQESSENLGSVKLRELVENKDLFSAEKWPLKNLERVENIEHILGYAFSEANEKKVEKGFWGGDIISTKHVYEDGTKITTEFWKRGERESEINYSIKIDPKEKGDDNLDYSIGFTLYDWILESRTRGNKDNDYQASTRIVLGDESSSVDSKLNWKKHPIEVGIPDSLDRKYLSDLWNRFDKEFKEQMKHIGK
jgi:hypothetical protein